MPVRLRRYVAALLAGLLLVPPPARAEENPPPQAAACHLLTLGFAAPLPLCIRVSDFYGDVCRTIATSAAFWGLPEHYFARLIWQESHFDPNALSPAGAAGIAQFMPSTGRLRGLADAYNPAEALARSAEYLHFLRNRFGNLGLAAAAYNGGENRMARYVKNGGFLPRETRDYVETITGRSVDAWLDGTDPDTDYAIAKDVPFQEACERMAEGQSPPSLQAPLGDVLPWGVLLAQDFSRGIATRIFERLQQQHASLLGHERLMLARGRNPNFGPRLRYFAMVGRPTRKEADALCAELRRNNVACLVRRN